MPSKMTRTLGTMVAGAVLSGGALAITATSADAAPRTPVPYYDCTYPYVCLYNNVMDIVLRYRDVTLDWQPFSRTDVYYGLNTRNDDVAYIRYVGGKVYCMPSGDNMQVYNLRQYGTPNGIRIDTSPVCEDGTPKLAPAKKTK
jgi:hypothetical protein